MMSTQRPSRTRRVADGVRGPTHSSTMHHDPHRPIARAEAREFDVRPALLAAGLLLALLLLL